MVVQAAYSAICPLTGNIFQQMVIKCLEEGRLYNHCRSVIGLVWVFQEVLIGAIYSTSLLS